MPTLQPSCCLWSLRGPSVLPGAVLQVQLLERHTLLLSFGMPDAATSRSSDASQQKAFFALYDVQSRAVVDFIPNTSEEFMKHYLALPNSFHAGSQSTDWER